MHLDCCVLYSVVSITSATTLVNYEDVTMMSTVSASNNRAESVDYFPRHQLTLFFLSTIIDMKKYIMDVHNFQEENITVLMDDGNHVRPTRANMLAAYRKIVSESKSGDVVFCHYSGHGGKLRDDNGDEKDGYDEVSTIWEDCYC